MKLFLICLLQSLAYANKYRTDHGDPFLYQADESYPADKSFALTQAFITNGHDKKSASPQLKQSTVNAMHIFEQNVLWIYVLIGVILLTAIIVGIVCCCCKGGDEKKDESMKNDEEQDPMMGEGDMMAPEGEAM